MHDDKELKEYRDLLKTPDHFEEGFDWKTVVGAVLCDVRPGTWPADLNLSA